jgi:hypothetical protein
MSENDNKYLFNPVSGRYILKGGTLHRRLIRQGKMEPIEFSKRTPNKNRRNVNDKPSRASGTNKQNYSIVKPGTQRETQPRDIPKRTKQKYQYSGYKPPSRTAFSDDKVQEPKADNFFDTLNDRLKSGDAEFQSQFLDVLRNMKK